MSEIHNIINKESVIVAPGQEKAPFPILSDGFCEEQTFPHLLPKNKFPYKVPRNTPLNPARYFNRLC